MNLKWIIIQASCSTHPVLMGGEHASGNLMLLHHQGDVSSIRGPPLGWQLCKEVRCCASVLDGEERGERGAAAPGFVTLALIRLLVRAYGLVSKRYLSSVNSPVKISNF